MVFLKCTPFQDRVYYIPARQLVSYSVSTAGVVQLTAPYPNGTLGYITRDFDGTEVELAQLLANA